jgi:hypothetical protein
VASARGKHRVRAFALHELIAGSRRWCDRTGDMAAPRFAPVSPVSTSRAYSSPDHVPDSWKPERPGEIDGLQPRETRLGSQGPDQGFALKIARLLEPEIHVAPGEHRADAMRGALGIALRRASLFSRAPVVHDLRLALTIWGFFDPSPDADLVEVRSRLFEGVAHAAHHYAEGRHIVDLVPESTLRLSPELARARYKGDWRTLTGVGSSHASH